MPNEYVLSRGDLVVTMTDLSKAADTLGYAAIIPESKGVIWLHNQRVGLVEIKTDAVDKGFLHYLMRGPEYRHWVVSTATGSTVKHTSPGRICDFEFLLPSKIEQKRIGNILSMLEDRVSLLHETNATLEAIAKTLFKSWFVDFDPVHAKAEGRQPDGLDATTAALFPDSFEESDLGRIPKEWRIGVYGDFAKQHKGSVNPLSHPDTFFEHYSIPAFDNGQMPVSEFGSEIKSNKAKVPYDAVLLSKLNPHIPRVWLPVNTGAHAICSTEFLVFVPGNGASKEFIYCAFTTDHFKSIFCQLVTGTSNSHQRVKPDGVASLTTVIPPSTVLWAFSDSVRPLFERVGHNRQQAHTLVQLRDTLLPRLISGQLRLPEAEEQIQEVMA